ncbi:MAG TPA: FAD-binding protein [Solirubrobacteraceae bacterium]|nr:FAD-binding protein [Solirubrobacteraceae bacterium]
MPDSPSRGADGRIHPADEHAIAEAIRFAAASGRRLRVRGAGHAPPGTAAGDRDDDLVLSLDRMRELRVVDERERLVRAQAGIHLGRDPSAAAAEGSLASSLLHRLAEEHRWTLGSTGGITHQTLGGFLATASAGGSLQHSLLDHVAEVRLIDGRGEPQVFSGVDGERGLPAVLPSLGLLGVITEVTLRCEPLFTIAGQEAIVDLAGAEFDLEGPDDGERLSLAEFLTRAEYARIEWWPQRGAERLIVWQAQRTEVQPGFRPTRYEEFTRYPVLGEALFSMLFVIFGNLGDPRRARDLLRRNADYVSGALDRLADAGRLTPRRRRLVRLLPGLLRAVGGGMPLLGLLAPLLRRALPWLVPAALDRVLPLDEHKPGMRRGEPQSFRDWSWQGLPMDNQASDVLLGCRFTELWVPLGRAAEVVRIVRGYFAAPAARESYHRTGLFAYELYGAPPATGWLHPGHTDGEDEWRAGALRLDVYWFADNAEDPLERFFPQFWELLRAREIPFRLHWGKEVPASSPTDRRWISMFAASFPRWQEFEALRSELDPDEVFLTEYWRERLGLWVAQSRPAARNSRS